jgi:hypothetical protein
MPHQGLHEPIDKLSAQTLDMHRAIVSLRERLDALDRNNQQHDACTDPELKLILAHQREAERAHSTMLLEWMRRRDPRLHVEMKKSLFKAGPITAQFHYEEPDADKDGV